MSRGLLNSTIPSSLILWETIPGNIRDRWSRNSFKYNLRLHLRGKKNWLSTARLNLTRPSEIILNRTRCDLIFKSHFFSHNFPNVDDPGCPCGFRDQSTKHLLLQCPLVDDLRQVHFHDLSNIVNFDYHVFCTFNMVEKIKLLIFGESNAVLPMSVKERIMEITSNLIIDIVDRIG